MAEEMSKAELINNLKSIKDDRLYLLEYGRLRIKLISLKLWNALDENAYLEEVERINYAS